MIVKPFRGLRPRPDLASRIPSLPYDVVTREEARELALHDPYSFLHVVRAEIDLAASVDPYSDEVYERAGRNFRKMIADGWLVRDDKPAHYVYRLRAGDHVQTGIVGAAAVGDYLSGRIRRHEHTRPEKEDDRVRLNRELGAHPGPVFLIHRPLPELSPIVAGIVERAPATRFTVPDGVEHQLWVVDDPELCRSVERCFDRIPATYVADGHHRAAAAARVGTELAAGLRDPSGREPCHYFLAVHFAASEVRVLAYNRVVRGIQGIEPQALSSHIARAGFDVVPDPTEKRPDRPGSFGMYLAGRWYRLIARPGIVPDRGDILERLDAVILSERVLRPILGVADLRNDRRIEFVGGSRGMEELERRVDREGDAVAFALFPTSVEDLMGVADSGQVMPPKSTWFEPKLRSGMVVLLLGGDRL